MFKKAGSLNSTTEVVCAKVKAQIVDELRQEYSLVCLLAAAGLARSTFYYQKSIHDRPDRYRREKQLILDIFRRHRGRYGYRRIAAACRNEGISISPNTVQRLMRELGIASYIRRKKYQSYKGTIGKVAPNILQRKFVATQPNQKWVADVTEFKVEDKKLYLSPVLDLFNGEVIAHQLAEKPDFNLVSNMLTKAIATLKEGDAPLIHSDQGWQYQSLHFQRELGRHNIAQSMSRKGNCYDNAVMESFFGTLKAECYNEKKFSSVSQLKAELNGYIKYYNHDRLKLKLNGLRPVQYRTQALLPA
ncbi:IS3 family transposase [Pseudomonas paraeruginosa]|uniref:IS3 family transposase n=1 Tax=Pseudomonas paraeruginosa TaxID=2994495 RepID=UPI0039FC4993